MILLLQVDASAQAVIDRFTFHALDKLERLAPSSPETAPRSEEGGAGEGLGQIW